MSEANKEPAAKKPYLTPAVRYDRVFGNSVSLGIRIQTIRYARRNRSPILGYGPYV